MYRCNNNTQKNYCKSYNKVNVASVQCEQSDTAVQRISELLRVIEITDYDKGVPTAHRLELYKTNRIDCYRVVVDGKLWKERNGGATFLLA